jgi:hypothetical protein
MSISLLAAIGGSWSGWQLRNGGWLHHTAIASVGSLYGLLPQQEQMEASDDAIKAGLANELAKRAADARRQQDTVGVNATDSQVTDSQVAEATPATSPAAAPVLANVNAPPTSTNLVAPPIATNPPAVASPSGTTSATDPNCCGKPSPAPENDLSVAPAPLQPAPSPDISADVQQQMLARAATLLHQGDIAGARTLLARLDRVGNGQASFELAQTYDSLMLNRWHVLGIGPDAEKAAQLYKRALNEGVHEAQDHIAASESPQR